MKPISLYLNEDVIDELDAYLAGRISRSSAVSIIIRKYLDDPTGLL